ncbi:MAG: DNA-3-methyladenine glycosylase [Candidatus Parcubacteria bacterium]|jgi:DNA-3-methyladenine glycosylase|nr:DNA-3-methyladenine glycosylase [Candidatus Parcubacteria bacterium]
MQRPQKIRVLKASFFNRPTVAVARDMIGCILARRIRSKTERHVITETEAYDGPHDLACHGSKGRTKRTEVLFGKPGHLYVYFIYGNHWLLNVVSGPAGYPAGVLIRGLQRVSGPGRLTKRLNITGALHGRPADKAAGLWFERASTKTSSSRVMCTPRIGIDYAGPIWSKKKYRFIYLG